MRRQTCVAKTKKVHSATDILPLNIRSLVYFPIFYEEFWKWPVNVIASACISYRLFSFPENKLIKNYFEGENSSPKLAGTYFLQRQKIPISR